MFTDMSGESTVPAFMVIQEKQTSPSETSTNICQSPGHNKQQNLNIQIFCLSVFGATAPSGPGPPHS